MVWAIAKNTGALRARIHDFKYSGRYGWASIFGRILVGYLDDYPAAFRDFDVITGMPFFPATPGRYDHIRLILERANVEAGGRWPLDIGDPSVIVKKAATPRMVGLSLVDRRRLAQTDLRAALAIPDPSLVEGKSILVVDDVFTEGSTLREVARALKGAGVARVSGLVLARQPWQ